MAFEGSAEEGWLGKKLGARRKGVLTIRGRLNACRAHGGEGIVGPLLHKSLLRWAFQGLSS
jgi:hypothetical protein